MGGCSYTCHHRVDAAQRTGKTGAAERFWGSSDAGDVEESGEAQLGLGVICEPPCIPAKLAQLKLNR